MLFYDGHCGLCHRGVRFVLMADRSGDRFRFAPLNGDSFRTLVPILDAATLADSIVLRTTDGRLLQRSAAVVHILRRLGGFWRLLGSLLGAVPAGVRDWMYDAVASRRHRLFARPPDTCPLIPTHLRARFDP
jgi:predicted DCC family thiol-disulfide oxidoreductase YuxK